jgi:hypothetical protein
VSLPFILDLKERQQEAPFRALEKSKDMKKDAAKAGISFHKKTPKFP